MSDQLPDLQDQKLLTLLWPSFSWSGRESLAFFLAYKGGQYLQYALKHQNLWSITWLTRPKFFDTPLTLIFMIGQAEYGFLFGLWRQPILSICIKTAKSLINYLTYKTKNCWRTVDSQFQNQAESISLSLLPIEVACTWLMNVYDQSPCRVTMMRSQTLLTLRWRSFCHGRIHNREPFTLTQYINNRFLPAVLCFSCTFSFITTLFFNDACKYTL